MQTQNQKTGTAGGTDTKPAVVEKSGAPKSDPVADAAKEAISAKRGRPSGSKTKGKGKPVDAATLQAQKELVALFEPDAWEPVVRAPADAMLALTGRKHWDLSEKEVRSLAVTGANSARWFLHTDPKWIALILFLFNATTVYGSRLVMDAQERKKEKDIKAVELDLEKRAQRT